MSLGSPEDLADAVRYLTPSLAVYLYINERQKVTMAELFSFFDRPFGHPVYLKQQFCFYLPSLLYFRAETKYGLFQIESFEDNDYIIDQIAHIIDLYPNILDFDLQELLAGSFIAVKWSRIYPDASDQDIILYVDLHCDGVQYCVIPAGKRQVKFSFLQPYNQLLFRCEQNSIVKAEQYLAISVALRAYLRAVTSFQDVFGLVCQFKGFEPISTSLESLLRYTQTCKEPDFLASPPTYYLLNVLYIRFLRKQLKQHFAQPSKEQAVPKQRLYLTIPFYQGKPYIFFPSFEFMNFVDENAIHDAIIDCFRGVFNISPKQTADLFYDSRFACVAYQYFGMPTYKPISVSALNLSEASEIDISGELKRLLLHANDEFLQTEQYIRMRENSYLCKKRSTNFKRQAIETLQYDSSAFFSEVHECIWQADIFDMTDLAALCQSFLREQHQRYDLIYLTEIGHFIPNSDAFEQQKGMIKARIGKLHGFEINMKVEFRAAAKKWGLKNVE